jgi:hypothetical protein
MHQLKTLLRIPRRYIKRFNRISSPSKLAVVLFLFASLVVGVYLVRTFRVYFSSAATAQLLFSPSSVTMPPNASAGVTVNSGAARITFARVELTFDRTKVNLSDEIQVNGPLKAVIGKTSRSAANSSGRIVVVVALCNTVDIPCSPAPTAPSGSFELFRVPLTAVGSQTGQTDLRYDTGGMQIVDNAQTNVTFSSVQNLTINFGGGGSTPTRSTTPTRVVTPTRSPGTTSTPTRRLTTTPTRSSSGTASPTRRPPTDRPEPTDEPQTTPTQGPSLLLGDINENGCIDIADYVILSANFGKSVNDQSADPRADVNGDGSINILDYSYIFEGFGECI